MIAATITCHVALEDALFGDCCSVHCQSVVVSAGPPDRGYARSGLTQACASKGTSSGAWVRCPA